jgi:hypothetical protein
MVIRKAVLNQLSQSSNYSEERKLAFESLSVEIKNRIPQVDKCCHSG